MECLAHKNFSGKFGEIRAKVLRTLKIMSAPTSMPDRIPILFFAPRPYPEKKRARKWINEKWS